MSGYGLNYKLTMSNPKIYASKFWQLNFLIFMRSFLREKCILLRICFSLQEKQFHAITPRKQMQTLLCYWL